MDKYENLAAKWKQKFAGGVVFHKIVWHLVVT